jgi:hypothetical protein
MVNRTVRHPTRALSSVALIAVALAAGVIAAVLPARSAAAAVMPPPTMAVHTEFDPATPGFGDHVDARIVIELNRRTVRPQTLRYTYALAPLTQLGSARTSRFVTGDLELITVVAPVTCVSAQCVTGKDVTTLSFGPVRATVSRTNGIRDRVSAHWPTLAVRGRVLPSDLVSASPRFESDLAPPAPSYSASPATLATLLDAAAIVAVLGAAGLIAWQLLVFARRRPARRLDALERALALTRDSQNQPVAQRRRSLGLLARLLDHGPLCTTARDLAWSEHQPEPDELEALVSEIERGRQA